MKNFLFICIALLCMFSYSKATTDCFTPYCPNNFTTQSEIVKEINGLYVNTGNESGIFNISYKTRKCCNPTTTECVYTIDIENITAPNGPTLFNENILKEITRKLLGTVRTDHQLPSTTTIYDIYVRSRTCFHKLLDMESQGCSEDCCIIQYTVGKENNYEVVLLSKPIEEAPAGNCSESCFTACQTSTVDLQSIVGWSPTNCDNFCYWRLDGNSVVSDDFNFIGPINGEDFIIKTLNNRSTPSIMERMRFSNNNRIDFRLNAWISMPLISFDADYNESSIIKHDPTMKIYRQTGIIDNDGLNYQAFPWWISVNMMNGNSYNAFNIWSGSPVIPGKETPTNMNKVFTILGNGNIGIGVQEPKQKLVVDGTICAKEVRVSLSGDPCWPDYVFDKNYNLKSIEELEKFIKTNKHLPEIPSADEILRDGVELGAIQAKLLQKIEELTLYIIQLKNENDEMKKILLNK